MTKKTPPNVTLTYAELYDQQRADEALLASRRRNRGISDAPSSGHERLQSRYPFGTNLREPEHHKGPITGTATYSALTILALLLLTLVSCDKKAPAWEAPSAQGDEHIIAERWNDARTAYRAAAELAEDKAQKEALSLKACGAWTKQSEALATAGDVLKIETDLIPKMTTDGCDAYYGELVLEEHWEAVAGARLKAQQFEKAIESYELAHRKAERDPAEKKRLETVLIVALKAWAKDLSANKRQVRPAARRLESLGAWGAAAALFENALDAAAAARNYSRAGNSAKAAHNYSRAGDHWAASRLHLAAGDKLAWAASLEARALKLTSPTSFVDAANAYMALKNVPKAKEMMQQGIASAAVQLDPSQALKIAQSWDEAAAVIQPLTKAVNVLLRKDEPFEARILLRASLKYLESHTDDLSSAALKPLFGVVKKVAKVLRNYPKLQKETFVMHILNSTNNEGEKKRQFSHHTVSGTVKNTTKRHLRSVELRVRLVEVNWDAVTSGEKAWEKAHSAKDKLLNLWESLEVETFQVTHIAPGKTKSFEFRLETGSPHTTAVTSLGKFNHTQSGRSDAEELAPSFGD